MIVEELVALEGWELTVVNGKPGIRAFGDTYPLTHPVQIHLKRYRDATDPELRYMHMKAAHDYLWPNEDWNHWDERGFRKHCNAHKHITYAGGASTGKSRRAAKIAILFWLADPKHRGVVVASTSLEGNETRVWGYIIALLRKVELKFPFIVLESQPPKVLYDRKAEGLTGKDKLHGIFAIAAKEGADDRTIKTWIGRHPDNGLLVILDEATDMPAAILKSLPNLATAQGFYQLMAIGNSNSIFDLHGLLSTPKDGWHSINPLTDLEWETTHESGICLFFSCYDSPAIFETNAEKRERMERYFWTTDKIEKSKKLLGENSEGFYRFTLGFWRGSSTDDTVISKQFISEFRVFERAEWSGLLPLRYVAGLDPAFSTGGDSCILRLALLGFTTNHQMVLDFRGTDLMFKVPIRANTGKSAELQIANYVKDKLRAFDVPISTLVLDANGQGRALGEVIRLADGGVSSPPLKIYSTKSGQHQQQSFDVTIMTSYELWFTFREYIQHGQIRGLDSVTANQLTTRLVTYDKEKGSKRPMLESKKAYKSRMAGVLPSLAHSPDEADAAALTLQAAIRMFGFAPGRNVPGMKAETFEDRKMQGFHEEKKREEMKRARPFDPAANFSGSMEDYCRYRKPF